ncbi:hypothetical protein ACA910_006331 [Epithemia clementina (nom. ined.)]
MQVHDTLPPLAAPWFDEVLDQLEMSQLSWALVLPPKYLPRLVPLKIIGGSAASASSTSSMSAMTNPTAASSGLSSTSNASS